MEEGQRRIAAPPGERARSRCTRALVEQEDHILCVIFKYGSEKEDYGRDDTGQLWFRDIGDTQKARPYLFTLQVCRRTDGRISASEGSIYQIYRNIKRNVSAPLTLIAYSRAIQFVS